MALYTDSLGSSGHLVLIRNAPFVVTEKARRRLRRAFSVTTSKQYLKVSFHLTEEAIFCYNP
jgi:hypothetical protein